MSQEPTGALPDVVVSKKHRVSMVWLVPLIAAAIAAYLAYDAYSSRGVPIVVTFKDGSGLVAGKTQIKFNGLPVGTVQSLEIGPNLENVIVKAKLDRHAGRVAVQGAEFWVVRPEVGLTGIRGIETVVSGPYIALTPGKGKATRYFVGLDQPPPADADQPGLLVTVRADSAGSLHVGSPVYYRQINIGVVSQIKLADTSQHVLIDLHINDPYTPLIRENSVFWNASGLDFSLGVLGIGARLDFESLESLLAGGIVMATPDEPGSPPESGHVFDLKKEGKKEYLKWSPRIELHDESAK